MVRQYGSSANERVRIEGKSPVFSIEKKRDFALNANALNVDIILAIALIAVFYS